MRACMQIINVVIARCLYLREVLSLIERRDGFSRCDSFGFMSLHTSH
jgi:hypothetical protein